MFKLCLKIIFILFCIIFVVFNSTNIEYQELEASKTINVEIKGEVIEDNIYTLDNGSSIKDLIDLCELSENADISSLNLNNKLYDNEVIVIPKISNEIKISINSSSLEELTTLPGIGKSIAQRIIDYRNNYGFFSSIEDIKLVKGIGESKYESIRERICL